MNWLTFFSEIIKALAWPMATILIALFFRDELKRLLRRIKRGKVGSSEFEFEQEVRALEETVIRNGEPQPVIPESTNKLLELASIDSGAAIIKAWSLVEKNLSLLANKRGIQVGFNPTRTVQELEKSQVLPPHLIELFRTLRTLRNQAAHDHDFNPSKESVVNYLDLTDFLIRNLELLARAS
jgi:hypothetical protein